ncbi:MAG: ABC transporter ATP-binding protein [Thermodesulfobacteriota bacterium]
MALLTVTGLSHSFGGLKAVDDVSFDVLAGQIKAVIGPNGAGKTTLFNLISGHLPVERGSLVFDGRRYQRFKAHQIARRGLARTFQNIKLFAGMTACENVMVGCHARSQAGFLAGLVNAPWTWPEERRIRRRAEGLLELFGLARMADTEATGLSFGQQRSIELARALAAEPRLLLLDEPAAGLNMYETAEIGRLIQRIRDQGVTVLLVEHDMSLVMNISDAIVVLSFGQKIAEGGPAAIQANPEVIRIYLGEDDAQGS